MTRFIRMAVYVNIMRRPLTLKYRINARIGVEEKKIAEKLLELKVARTEAELVREGFHALAREQGVVIDA
jgi:hypothetical protein